MDQIRWDKHFIKMARQCSEMSEDDSTKVGAVIVGPDREVRSTGYNGLPRGVDALMDRFERPGKYHWFEHAERNAIYNAARIGVPTADCTIYVQGPPCADCTRGIIQSGIKRLVIDATAYSRFSENPKWVESIAISQQLSSEGGVEVEVVDVDS